MICLLGRLDVSNFCAELVRRQKADLVRVFENAEV
jgi:hypothetical protein